MGRKLVFFVGGEHSCTPIIKTQSLQYTVPHGTGNDAHLCTIDILPDVFMKSPMPVSPDIRKKERSGELEVWSRLNHTGRIFER